MRLIMTAALALCLSSPAAWADTFDKSKSAPASARIEALTSTPRPAAQDPLNVQRQVLADFNRDIEARLRARRLAAN